MERVTAEELVQTVRADRRRFDAILDRVPADRLADPLLPGGWSIKDVLAHISWGEREALGVIEARALAGSPLWDVAEEERNETVVRASRSRSAAEVVEEYRNAFDDYVRAIAGMSDEDLNDPLRLPGLPERIPGWRPWRVVYDPGHYEEHGRTIERALAALHQR